jgi:uncharacterized protein (TIGR03663 family)
MVKTPIHLSRWFSPAILLLAFLLRILWLGDKPAHFDEGVNGSFVDTLTQTGFYHYDPTNFHGPLHFYLLFLAQTLLGHDLWVLRLPTALLSTACVALALAYRRFLNPQACQIAALAIAISPAMVFYGRYAIHESLLLFFLLLTGLGLAGLSQTAQPRDLWRTALGITGLILTKETYLIHLATFAVAIPCLLLYERVSPSTLPPFSQNNLRPSDFVRVTLVSVSLLLFFYSGGFLDWPAQPLPDPDGFTPPRGALAGLYECWRPWIQTSNLSANHLTGHEKPPLYWLQLLGGFQPVTPENLTHFTPTIANEWPAALGLLGSLALLAPHHSRLSRFLAISGLGTLLAYSIIAYKTPWCLISIIWPFYFILGLGIVWSVKKIGRSLTALLAGVLAASSLHATWQLNFHHPCDESEPYVYVQSREDVSELLIPLQRLLTQNPLHRYLTGHILIPEQHPWIWLLADFPKIDFPPLFPLPQPLDADFLLVDDPLVPDVEPRLHDDYFKSHLKIRGGSVDSSTLYLRKHRFQSLFPNRLPEFQPHPTNPEDSPN